MNRYSVLQRKKSLTYAEKMVNLEIIMLCEISQSQNHRYWVFHLDVVHRAVKFWKQKA